MNALSCSGDGSGLGCEHNVPCPIHGGALADLDGFDAEPHELSAMEAASLAVTMALDAAAVDPDLRRVLRPGSELFERLCAAEAAMLGRTADELLEQRAAQKPEGPRLLLTYEEWTRARAAEVEREGAIGSHWPGKDRRCPLASFSTFRHESGARLGCCANCGRDLAEHREERAHVSER